MCVYLYVFIYISSRMFACMYVSSRI